MPGKVKNSPLLRSTDFRLKRRGGSHFNSLAFLSIDKNGNDVAYNYSAGLHFHSSPSEIERILDLDLKFLKKYGFSMDLSLITTTDISAMTMRQRKLRPVPVLDVHGAHSASYENGISHNNQGAVVDSFFKLITSQYKLKDSSGNFYFYIY